MTPPVVRRAAVEAQRLGIEGCSHAVGALVHVLAGRPGTRRVAAIGTGGATGAAWLAASLRPGALLVAADCDAAAAGAALAALGGDPDVGIAAGDWREQLEPEAPYDLLVVFDTAPVADPAPALRLLAPRATVVVVGAAAAGAWREVPGLVATTVTAGDGTAVVLAGRPD